MSRNQKWELATHVVDRHCNVRLADLLEIGAVPRPELYTGVPASAYDHRNALIIDEAEDVFDWRCVLTDHCYLLRIQVIFFDGAVGAGKEQGHGISLPTHSENGEVAYFVLEDLLHLWRRWVSHVVVVVINAEDENVAVPSGGCQHTIPHHSVRASLQRWRRKHQN